MNAGTGTPKVPCFFVAGRSLPFATAGRFGLPDDVVIMKTGHALLIFDTRSQREYSHRVRDRFPEDSAELGIRIHGEQAFRTIEALVEAHRRRFSARSRIPCMNGPGGSSDRSARRETPRSRSFKIAGALLGFLGLRGPLVFLIILFQPPKPAAVVLVGADYATNLTVPHNLLGWKGLEAIEAVSRTPRPWTIFNPACLQLIQRQPP